MRYTTSAVTLMSLFIECVGGLFVCIHLCQGSGHQKRALESKYKLPAQQTAKSYLVGSDVG